MAAPRRERLGLSADRALTMYRQILLARLLDERMSVLNRQGRAPFMISGQGQEGTQVAAAAALRPGRDWLCPYYRDLAFCLAWGMTPLEVMLGVFSRAADPTSGGRQMPAHYGLRRLRIVSGSSVVATQIVHAAGIAYASKVRDEDDVTVVCAGDGSTSEGDFHEGLNFAGIHRLAVICLVQDNDYAISVPHRLQMTVDSVADRAASYGWAGATVDGSDVLGVYEVMVEAARRARSGEGPTLIDAKVTRFSSHSSDDDQRRYRPALELSDLPRHDPLLRFGTELLEDGTMTEARAAELRRVCEEEVEAAVREAEASPSPDPADLGRHVLAEDT